MSRMVSLGNSSAVEATIYLSKIKDINKEEDKGTWVKKLPYELEFTATNPDTNSATIKVYHETQAALSAKDWNKRFYLKNDQVRYSREFELNALMEIFKAKKDEKFEGLLKEKAFDIDWFLNKSFKGAIIELDTGYIIDWVETFRLNGVKVPTAQELESKETVTASATVDELP